MKIHAHHEDFEPHFVGITDPEQRLERISEKDLQENGLRTEDVGKIKASFANLLALPTHSFLTRQQALFYKSTSGNSCFSSFFKESGSIKRLERGCKPRPACSGFSHDCRG